MQLVDEQDDLARRVLDLLEDRLQALLKLASILCPGNKGTEIQADDALVLEILRNVPACDPLGQPLDDRGLADPGLADEDGIVLRPAAQNLDDAPHLFVPADHRIELALAGQRGQVAPVPLERLVGRLGSRAGHPLAASDLLQSLINAVPRDSQPAQDLPGGPCLLVVRKREEEMLRRDIVVLEALGFLLRRLEGAPEPVRHADLRWAGCPSHASQRRLQLAQDRVRLDSQALQDGRNHAFVLGHQRVEEVFRLELGVTPLLGQPLRRHHGVLGFLGELAGA